METAPNAPVEQDDLFKRYLKPEALEVIQFAIGRGYITTSEVSTLISPDLANNAQRCREVMLQLTRFLSEHNISIKVGNAPAKPKYARVKTQPVKPEPVDEIKEDVQYALQEPSPSFDGTVDEKLYLETYEELHGLLFNYANRSINDWALAQDYVQECYYRLWKAIITGKKIDNVKAYLFWIMKNMVVDKYRQKKVVYFVGDLHDFVVPIQSTAARQTLFREVLWYVNLLPEEDRDMLIQRYIKGMSPEEIAESMDISPNLACVRIHRLVKKVRERVIQDQVITKIAA